MATKQSSLRDKYKPADLSKLKSKITQDDQDLATGGSKNTFLPINDGSNRFRIFPNASNPEDFYMKRGVHWLTFPADSDSTKDTYRGTVPNSRIHGGTAKDVIEEYVRLATIHLKKSDEEEKEIQEKIKKMLDWKGGLTLSVSWMAYANKMSKNKEGGWNKEFGLLEMKRSVRDGLNKLSNTEDGDEPITVDPFTDPDEGRPIIITYNSNAKKSADYYSVSIGKNSTPLTDEELEDFENVTPLEELYGTNTYKKEDFDKACEGLQYYDEENEIGLWETDEWQELLEELGAEYDDEKPKTKVKGKTENVALKKSKGKVKQESEEEEEEEEKPVKTTKKVVVEEEEEEEEEAEEEEESEEDKFSEMDREELKMFNRKNNLGIIIKTSMSDEDIRNLIRKSAQEESEEEEEEEEKPVKTTKNVSKTSLDEIKERLKARAGKK